MFSVPRVRATRFVTVRAVWFIMFPVGFVPRLLTELDRIKADHPYRGRLAEAASAMKKKSAPYDI